jgi:hypothetical protein
MQRISVVAASHLRLPVIAVEQLPSAKSFSTASKKFFFDMFSNERGVCVACTRPLAPVMPFVPGTYA